VEELGECYMAAVSDLWRTTDELIEQFTPVLNPVFNIVNRRGGFKYVNCSRHNINGDIIWIFTSAHDYNIQSPDSWTTLNV
jgi:hypothetical protein